MNLEMKAIDDNHNKDGYFAYPNEREVTKKELTKVILNLYLLVKLKDYMIVLNQLLNKPLLMILEMVL